MGRVAPPRPDLSQPGRVVLRSGLAEASLDRRVDEYPRDRFVPRRGLEDPGMGVGPASVHPEAVPGDHRGRGNLLPFRPAQRQPVRRAQPDIDVQPDLVRAVPRRHRPAARLADVAHVEPRPARFPRGAGQALDEEDRAGMAPVAISREPHRLPARSRFRQSDGAGQAARRIPAERAGAARRGRSGLAERVLGRLRAGRAGRQRKTCGQGSGEGQIADKRADCESAVGGNGHGLRSAGGSRVGRVPRRGGGQEGQPPRTAGPDVMAWVE